MEENLKGRWSSSQYDKQFEDSPNGKLDLSKWEGVTPQSVMESQPLATDFNFEDFDRLLGKQGKIDPIYGDIEEARAQAQSGAEKIATILPRIGAKIVSETAKIPGTIYGLGEWASTGFDVNKFKDSVNNSWVKGVDEATQAFNENVLPVYKRREIEEGGFFKQITSPEFWATEGADGIGFLTSMMIPGAVLRGAGAGQAIMKGLSYVPKISKFGQAGKLTKAGLKAADAVNDWTSTGVNTVIEATAEGVENMKATEQALIDKKFKELMSMGQYDPQEAQDLAQEYVKTPEVQAQISKGGFNTFKWNLGILLGPNILDQKWLFKGANAAEAKGVIGKRLGEVVGKTDDNILSSIERLTPKQVLGKVGKVGTIGVAKEGFFEEGFQYAASELEKNKVVNPEAATNLLETYADALGDTDMQKSIFLGAMLGGGMGMIGGYKSAKREDEYLFGREASEASNIAKKLGFKDKEASKGVMEVFKNNFVKRYQSVNDLYKTNDKGEVELDEKGESIIDPVKVAQYGSGLIRDAVDKELLQDAIDKGDKEGYEYIKTIRDFKYMVPFVKEEGGYELLQQHINNLANKELEELAATGMYDKMPVEEVKQNLLNKAKEVKSIVDKADRSIVPLYDTKDTNKKYSKGFNENLYDSYISSEYQKNFINSRLDELNNKASQLIHKPSKTTEVTTDTLVPGDFINFDGDRQQVIQHKDGVLKTISMSGDITSTEDVNIKDTKVQKFTDFHPIDRKELGEILIRVNNYNKDLEQLNVNQEKLFTPEGQQKAFEEYATGVKKMEKDIEDIPKKVVKEDIDNAETVKDLKEVKEKVTTTSEIKPKEKDIIITEVDNKIREKEAEDAKLAQQKKESITPVKEVKETKEDKDSQQIPQEYLKNNGKIFINNKEVEEYSIDENLDGSVGTIHVKFKDSSDKEALVTQEYLDSLYNSYAVDKNGNVFDLNNSKQIKITRVSSIQQLIEEEIAETHDTANGEIVEYDRDRNQEGREDELNLNEKLLAESEFKTTYVNLAYLATEYKEKNGVIRTKLDSSGNIIAGFEEQNIPNLVDEYTPGTEVIMYVDESDAEYFEKYKDDVDNIPIVIQTVADNAAGKAPFLHLHVMDWIKSDRVAEDYIQQVKEETKALREFIFNAYKQNNKVKILNTIVDKSGGFILKPPRDTKNPNQYTLKQVISDDTRPQVAFGDKLGKLETNLPVENAYKVLSGIPYLILPKANGQYFGIWLKQEPISKNPNFEKYTKTVVKIFEEYNKTNGAVDIKSLQELREEIGKYFHVNTNKLSDEVLQNENREFIFRIAEVTKGKFTGKPEITLRTPKGLLNYVFDGTNWISFSNKEKNKFTTVKDMSSELQKYIPNKYPNITKNGIKQGENFEVYELQGDKIVKVKKNYIDFLSENRVVTTSVQPRIVQGQRVYFGQPNIRLNTNVSNLKVLEETTSAEVETEESNINLDMSGIIPNFEELLQQLIENKDSYQDKVKQGERIKKYCNGTNTGKGNLIKR